MMNEGCAPGLAARTRAGYAGVAWTERAALTSPVRPSYPTGVFYSRRDMNPTSIPDLDGMKVAVVKGHLQGSLQSCGALRDNLLLPRGRLPRCSRPSRQSEAGLVSRSSA